MLITFLKPESVNTPTEDHHTIKVTSSIAPKLEKMPYSVSDPSKHLFDKS